MGIDSSNLWSSTLPIISMDSRWLWQSFWESFRPKISSCIHPLSLHHNVFTDRLVHRVIIFYLQENMMNSLLQNHCHAWTLSKDRCCINLMQVLDVQWQYFSMTCEDGIWFDHCHVLDAHSNLQTYPRSLHINIPAKRIALLKHHLAMHSLIQKL
mgnify:CR=1 FL=1